VRLVDIFEGRRQLFVQHFMFDPSWEDGCSSCSAEADELSAGTIAHLHARDTTFASIGRAPYAKIAAYKGRKGWSFPFYSSHGSDFNYDFHVTIDESVAPLQINFRGRDEFADAALATQGWLETPQPFEIPGFSCFLHDGERVFHTYSTFGRGTEAIGGAYGFLDLTALGRQEDWEEPKGRAAGAHAASPDFAT
jgi:predicted dithiol-disulfide oxidoreductase (DUF899 family)